jgi:RNA polymerase sigma-70 factor, ECF subfamily
MSAPDQPRRGRSATPGADIGQLVDVVNPVGRDRAGVELMASTESTRTPRASAAVTELDPAELERRLEGYRQELRAHCRRTLGSAFEAEDAVQETLLRAWRSYSHFEGRAALRSWLHRIASNVCVDMLRGRQRRPQPIDLAPGDVAVDPSLAVVGAGTTALDGRALAAGSDPAEVAVSRDAVRAAVVAAMHHLPPRQRAVLILREVLRWHADEVAELLGSSVASVNSALQRARATLAACEPSASRPSEPSSPAERRALARYLDALERCDVESLASDARRELDLEPAADPQPAAA